MTTNEIYHQIGQSLMDYIPEDWSIAILEIDRVDGVAGWKGVYTTKPGVQKHIDVWEYSLNAQIIHELHAITTANGHNRWNRLKFTLVPAGKFELDFIWDQKYQDEIDTWNKKK